MKKKVHNLIAIFATMLVFLSMQLNAQNMEVIGSGTIETNYPPNTQVFEYNWSSMMYTSDEMGSAKSITKIAFDQTTDYGEYWEYAILENQKIYIKQSSLSSFTSLDYENPEDASNGYTLVYDGTIQFNLGWSEITLPETFEYDGTSAFIVHWENHRGTSAPIVNVKFNASTVSGDVFKAVGADATFPTSFGTYINERPNLAIFYSGDGPTTPVNPSPANNSFKTLVDTDLEFIIGDNTTSYDVYFGLDNPPSQVLTADVAVTAPGTFSINPSEILDELLNSYSPYYWQIVAKNATSSSASQVWSFTTQGIIEDLPYNTSFEDQPLRGIYADTVDWSWNLSGPPNWTMADYDAHSGTYSIMCNVWGEYLDTYNLVSPRIYLTENQQLSFWWKMNGGDGSGINAYFDITTDGGETWELLQEFPTDTEMSAYEQIFFNLADYAGNNVYLRWRYETLTGYTAEHIFLDDLTIEDAPEGAVIYIEEPELTFLPLAYGAETYLPLEVTNNGVSELLITGSDMSAPFTFVQNEPIAPGETAEIMITMTAATIGNFTETIEFTGNFEGDAQFQLNGSVYEVGYDFFENADASDVLPEKWNVIRTLDPYDTYTNVTIEATAYDAYSAPNAFRMLKMNDTISPLMLITEGVGGYATNKLRFYAKKSYDDYDAELQIGLTTDPLNAEAFIPFETFVMTTEFQEFEVEFPNDSPQPYIAFKFNEGRYASSIWIDDIEWDIQGANPPYCPSTTFPAEDATDIDIMMDLNLNWTSTGGNPTGYKLSVGTNAEANNIIDGVDVGNVLSYTFPTDPTYSTEYFWKVIAYNNNGESSGCGTSSFTTMGNPVLNVPFSENFDALDAFGDLDYPLGWSIENENNDNFPWDLISDVATPDVAHSTPNAMHMLFSLNPMSDYLFTAPINLLGGTSYELSFWYKTLGDSWVPEPVERMKVFVGTDNNSASMTREIYDNINLDNLNWESTTVNFSVDTDGEYYLGFYGYSTPNQGLLLLDDVAVDISTSISNNIENKMSIYPNPAEDKLNIVSESTVNTVKVYNISGSLVYENNFNETSISLDVDNLTNGVYVVYIETENGLIREKLIIK